MAAPIRKCFGIQHTRLCLTRLCSGTSSESSGQSDDTPKPAAAAPKAEPTPDPTLGQSDDTPKPAAAPPKAEPTPDPTLADNTQYRAKEYYGYKPMSFADLEIDMEKLRLVQPSKFQEAKGPAK